MKTTMKFGLMSAMAACMMAPTDGEASGAGAAPVIPTIPAATDTPAIPAATPETAAQKKAREKAEKDAAKVQAKADKDAAKAEADAEKAAAAVPVAKAPADTKNGVTRPSSGKTKTVWDVADSMSAAKKEPIDRKSLTDVLLAPPHELVVGTIHTQYGKWRKYHGLVAVRTVTPAVPPAADTPVVPPAPAA